MATLSITPLAIPDDTIQGTGSYTIPANKYALLSGTVAASAAASRGTQTANVDASIVGSAAGSGNSFSVWLVAGDSITVTNTAASAILSDTSSGGNQDITSSSISRVRVNLVNIASALCTASTGRIVVVSGRSLISGLAETSWNASIYPIPKDNLPLNLQVGN